MLERFSPEILALIIGNNIFESISLLIPSIINKYFLENSASPIHASSSHLNFKLSMWKKMEKNLSLTSSKEDQSCVEDHYA